MGCQISKLGGLISHEFENLINYGTHGLIGVEAATAYWGLSTFWTGNPIFLVKDNTEGVYFVECALSTLFSKDINTENVVALSEHLFVTDKEQTVCDMIRFKRHEFHLFETLISAYNGEADIDRLEKMAKDYGILEEMHRLRDEAYEVEDEG